MRVRLLLDETMREEVLSALRELGIEQRLRIRVRGFSMAPDLPDGATVEVSPRRIYLPGDVIAFVAPKGELRIHRVLGYKWHSPHCCLITKGDNASWIDPPVALDQVLGLVRGGDCARSIYKVPISRRFSGVGFLLRKLGTWCRDPWTETS